MKNLILLISLLLISCNQRKVDTSPDVYKEQIEIEQTKDKKPNSDSIISPDVLKESPPSLTCDCTCSCKGKIFTITVYPCKNKEISCERECKKKCKS